MFGPSFGPPCDAPRPAALWRLILCYGWRRSLLRQPPLGLEQPPEHELNLPVQAPQLIVGPVLEGVEDRRVDAEEKCLALGH
jgi:hypothetical protein